MKIFFALLIVIILAFSGYHLTFRSFRLPLFARKFYLTGTEFLFLGLLLGPQFLNVLDEQTCRGLEPLAALLLGWIGLIFGFQFEVVKLKRFLPEFFLAAVSEGILTFIPVFCGVYFALPLFIEITGPIKIVTALAMASAATCTAHAGIALLAPDSVAGRQNTVKLLQYISSIDSLVALLIFSLAFFFRASLFAGPSWVRELGIGFVISVVVCVSLLVLYLLFLSQKRSEQELTLVVIGMTVFISGTASIINYSPLLTNFFMGFCIANLTRDKERIYNILISVEKPVYILLLFFLGGTMQLGSAWIIYAAAGYCLLRGLGKLTGGYIITKAVSKLRHQPAFLGFGMLEQGGLSFAILFDFQKAFPFETTMYVVSMALFAILFNDFLSPFFLKQLLKEGEK
jgi:Kef-type K+ transport system membrane component KefB